MQQPTAPSKQTIQKPVTSVADINTECKTRFKIDKGLADYLDLEQWCTFKEVTIGLLRFNKKVKDFYDRHSSSFNAFKYPVFLRYFPNQSKITSADLK